MPLESPLDAEIRQTHTEPHRLVEIVIPEATLPAIELDDRYEPLLRHLSDLPSDVAPPLGSAATLAASVRSDAGAGLRRDIPNDYIQALRILRELHERVERDLMTLAVIAHAEGVSIVAASEAAGVAPNTLRSRLAHTTTSLARQGGADESPF